MFGTELITIINSRGSGVLVQAECSECNLSCIVREERQQFKMSTMKPVDNATNGDKEVQIMKIPEMMFNNDRREIRVNRSNGGVENGFEIGRHGMVVQLRER